MKLREWTLHANWMDGRKYSIEIPAGSFESTYGLVNDTLRAEFTTLDPDLFSTLIFDLQGGDTSERYVLMLLDEQGKEIEVKRGIRTSSQVTFRFVPPGMVQLRLLQDSNDNGEWDTGSVLERRQPERVEFFIPTGGEVLIEAKENWELEFTIDMGLLFAPPTMESMTKQLERRQAEHLKRREEARLKALEREQESGGSGSSGGMSSGMGSMGSALGGF